MFCYQGSSLCLARIISSHHFSKLPFITSEAKKLFNEFHSELHSEQDKLNFIESFIDFIKSLFGFSIADKVFEEKKGAFLEKIDEGRISRILNITVSDSRQL